jgi:NADH dehydrogenase FAD-containing subunit
MFRKALSSAKSIVVAGGGPAGVETAGELGEYLNGQAGWFHSGMSKPKVQITVVTAGPKSCQHSGQPLRNKLRDISPKSV